MRAHTNALTAGEDELNMLPNSTPTARIPLIGVLGSIVLATLVGCGSPDAPPAEKAPEQEQPAPVSPSEKPQAPPEEGGGGGGAGPLDDLGKELSLRDQEREAIARHGDHEVYAAARREREVYEAFGDDYGYSCLALQFGG